MLLKWMPEEAIFIKDDHNHTALHRAIITHNANASNECAQVCHVYTSALNLRRMTALARARCLHAHDITRANLHTHTQVLLRRIIELSDLQYKPAACVTIAGINEVERARLEAPPDNALSSMLSTRGEIMASKIPPKQKVASAMHGHADVQERTPAPRQDHV
jgi:hypothetical protein